jgi:hypothetical protein
LDIAGEVDALVCCVGDEAGRQQGGQRRGSRTALPRSMAMPEGSHKTPHEPIF